MRALNEVLGLSHVIGDHDRIVATPALNSFLIASLHEKSPLLVVTHSSRRAEELFNEVTESVPTKNVFLFPAWETLPHEKLSPKSDTVAQRLRTLNILQSIADSHSANDFPIVIAPVRAFVQPINTHISHRDVLKLSIGDEISLEALTQYLVINAYSRTDLVEKRGEFAVRGGIVDLFLPLMEHPIRLEFFGDEIEEMRYFAVSDQRTFEPVVGGIEILPSRELLITDEVKIRAEDLSHKFPELQEMCGRIANGIYVEGMESLSGVLTETAPLMTFLPTTTRIVLMDDERIRLRSIDLIKTAEEFLEAAWSSAANGGATPLPLHDELERGSYTSLDVALEGHERTSINTFGDESSFFINDFLPLESYRSKHDQLFSDIRRWIHSDYLVIVSAHNRGLSERMRDLLSEADIPVRHHEELHTIPVRGTVAVTTSAITHGFINEKIKIVFITDHDISGVSSSQQERMPSRRKKAIDPLELKRGDYVVHEHHGVGRYIELVERTISGATREYLVIEYAPSKRGQPGDRIYVPTDSLEQVTRYVGGEAPAIHRIGGADWIKAKSRAKKAVKEIAGELIRLYAARTSAPGYAFSPDTPWQRELEDAFSYVETADQLSTIEEVKRDMERPYPMDRLVCGDVGYGKTEIAIRAAFKAVQDGKQVAVLVPTTLLVQQHLATFTERYTGFPIKVAGLSRFNTAKENKDILSGLASGAIDIVIGTHRLLSRDVVMRDLGLIIVDEEQRFGVEHKEALKKMRTTVDVLAMSATPIPRTLEMAVTGIREMSTITTPPEERHPVLTYVGPYDDKQVTAAIHRELLRDGQVFYIHNRVESIDTAAARLRTLVPEARIAIAHGQMAENVLEDVILAFWNRQFDILVCTTIVENGIDVPNANTLIVERADLFGLSQLHQIRGRVGRSRERAYAYFLYPTDKPLTELALDRLTTISTHTELGSGMQVALKDLEIRGAGNLLGGEQSGHIADVGFDLYMRMVGEAVAEYKSGYFDEAKPDVECRVELPVTAHLSPEFITGDRLRLDIYRRLADSRSTADIESIREELIDRFGDLPIPAQTLLHVAQLRVRAKELGIAEVVLQGNFLRVAEVELKDSAQLRIQRLYPGSQIKAASKNVLIARPKTFLEGLISSSDAIEATESEDSEKSEGIRNTALITWTLNVLDDITGKVRSS
ncbi:MAG: transcription-repair coupling factor [Candidatus Nanopelagicaceae bacterium]